MHSCLSSGTEASHAGLTADDACFGSETGTDGCYKFLAAYKLCYETFEITAV